MLEDTNHHWWVHTDGNSDVKDFNLCVLQDMVLSKEFFYKGWGGVQAEHHIKDGYYVYGPYD